MSNMGQLANTCDRIYNIKLGAIVSVVYGNSYNMEITNICVIFLTMQLINGREENLQNSLLHSRQLNEKYGSYLIQDVSKPTLSRVKRQFGYGYDYDPYYYRPYRRPYPIPIPIIIGGGFIGGRGFGYGRGFGGRGFGGRGFGGRGFGGRGFGGRGFGGRGIGGRGAGGIGGGRGGRG